MKWAAATLLVGWALAAAESRAESFADILGQTAITRPLTEAMADTVGRSIPVPAASAGVVFTFDKESHAFVRERELGGQLFLERPRPLGRGKWNLSLDYEWIKFDQVDGQDIDDLSDTAPPIVDPQTNALFTVPRFDLGLTTHQVTMSATYGVTDDLDVSLTLPLLYSVFDVDVALRVVGPGQVQRASRHETAFGPGDLLLRGKYRFVKAPWGDLAAGLVLRLPTGNEDDFQGTGSVEVLPALYAATSPVALGERVRLQGYANAGLDLVADDVGRSEGRFGLGLDCAVAGRVAFGAAFLAREQFQAVVPTDAFDVERFDPATGARFQAPLFGLEGGRQSFYDFSLGGRVMLWRDTVIGFANVLLPLNDDGFRSNVIPLVGVEAVF